MRRELALVLLPLMMAQGCASGGSAPPVTGGPPDLAAVNLALADEPATVELASGETVRDVEEVKMTGESTSWRDGDRVRTVPTAEVSRVTEQPRRRFAGGLGWGFLAGLPVAWLVAAQQPMGRSTSIFSDDQGTAFVLAEAACGVAGMLITGRLRQPRVVYLAPAVRTAAAPSGSGVGRCRLAPEPVPPGSPAIECAPAAR